MWLIPEMQKVRAQRNLKPLAFPKCFYASADDAIFILENAKSLNYEVVEKKPERKLFKKCIISELGNMGRIHNT